jgi:hypothetical protein
MMPRPVYETSGDRDAEHEIAEVLKRCWKLTSCDKLSPAYGLDFALRRDAKIVAFAEIKDRDIPLGMPGGYYLAAQKARSACILAQSVHIPTLLVVRCRSGLIGFWYFCEADDGAIWAGRKDRGDEFDMEPCVVFPWARFKVISDD